MNEKRYLQFTVSTEQAQTVIEQYENNTKGERFIKSLDASKKFRKAHDDGLFSTESMYLAALVYAGHDDLYDLMMKTYNLGFTKGYRSAQRKERAKMKEGR